MRSPSFLKLPIIILTFILSPSPLLSLHRPTAHQLRLRPISVSPHHRPNGRFQPRRSYY
ncbi:MAG: hypothetical protein KC423_20455 [Anaerolineales bacterium]|nr:hypothetical protein [Anaerolineales bacterium]